MLTLATADIVGIWELGQRRPNWHKALITLAPALPHLAPDTLSKLTIGERNAFLFALRRAVVGPVMNALVHCPRCREPLEFEQVIAELLDGYAPPDAREFEFASGGFAARYRLLTSEDLAHAAGQRGVPGAKAALIARAVIVANLDGEPIEAADLPRDFTEALGDHMAAADPLAQVAIQLACAACEHVWGAQLDIVTFLWSELEVQAKQLLSDVVTLAGHFGWREADILAMSPARREYYMGAIA
jgi:hypothetical protein